MSIAYSADGQPVEITLLDVIGRLKKEEAGEDETTIVLTERESRLLVELVELPPPPSERLLATMAKHRKLLRANEPSIDTDGCAWLARQARLLWKSAPVTASVEPLDLIWISRRLDGRPMVKPEYLLTIENLIFYFCFGLTVGIFKV